MPSPARLSGLSSKAVSGAGWMFASTAAGRAVAVLGQIGIGRLLLPADFGVWALALSMATTVVALRNGGTTQILIQRGSRFAAEAQLFLRYSLAFNLLAAAILGGLSVPYLLAHNAVGTALLGIGLSVPLSTPAMLYRAKLIIDGRFRGLALIDLGAGTLWQVSVFGFAYAGFGAASFAYAPILRAIFETIATRLLAGKLPDEQRLRPAGDYLALLRQSGWVMLSAAAGSLATNGDYFAVGTLTDMTTVGIYYFAFQMVSTLNMPMWSGVDSVLPTSLVKLNDVPSRQMTALVRAMRMIVLIALPLAIAFALAAPWIIHLLWHGKWDVAVRPTQILAACLPAWLVIQSARSLLEARGYWRLRFLLLAVNGIGGIGSAAIGTFFGSVPNIALTVATFYVSFSLSLLLALGKLGATLRDVADIAIKPLALNCGALATTLMLRRWIGSGSSDTMLDLLATTVFVVLVGIGNLAIFKPVWMELLVGLASGLRKRGGAAVANT